MIEMLSGVQLFYSYSFRSFRETKFKKNNKMRKFYAYAFGLPLILTSAAFIIDYDSEFLPDLRYMVYQMCAIEVSVIERFVNYFVTIAVLLTNTFFFAASAWNIYKVHREISRMKSRDNQENLNFQEMKSR